MLSAALSSPPASPPWTDLPWDLTANILERLEAAEILHSAQFVCATWLKVCHDPSMWRVIKFVNTDYSEDKLTMMCRRAVDLSQGQLIDLTIAFFCDDELLHYIADRSSHIQLLILAWCTDLSATSLIEAVKKLDELKELHLIEPTWILIRDIEAVGNICPKLKNFPFNWASWRRKVAVASNQFRLSIDDYELLLYIYV